MQLGYTLVRLSGLQPVPVSTPGVDHQMWARVCNQLPSACIWYQDRPNIHPQCTKLPACQEETASLLSNGKQLTE